MKDLSLQELDIMLCSTGCLPPRTEDELLFFTQMYEDYSSRLANKHVDIDAIINGTCRVMSSHTYELEPEDNIYSMVADDADITYSMAARNYDKLPKEILDKMRKQHRTKNDDKD